MSKSKNQEPGITWRQLDGRPVSCEEKLAMLNENLDEIPEYCQEALEDALLMCVRLGAVPAELSDKRRAKAGGGCHAQVRADVAVTIPSGSAHR